MGIKHIYITVEKILAKIKKINTRLVSSILELILYTYLIGIVMEKIMEL